ncbi:c-type cytochrome [Bradyrhizobium sp.]|uniref:c-type cytochrome n=1 Tax=Bradyrhizobium sp. TaxID=376 RepID=UPI001EC547C5|nr:cytochrome c [Bradyrhizobium sp.]MBV8916634.1 cytochrome c [Bradyrhizobium sp.]MBV9982436.1 cytochrome c [Bradyrhizobium sp.]
MKLKYCAAVVLLAVLVASQGIAMPARAQTPEDLANFDVNQLFASTCGFCHSDGGREAGKGPQLMGDQHDDDFLRNRIKNGKQGAMPAFGGSFNEQQIDAIIIYIRDLKPR